jgi:YgiT-type zinc finger domain-containing protein
MSGVDTEHMGQVGLTENIILTGQIIERQRDRQTREVKCVVWGFTLDDSKPKPSSKSGPPEGSSLLPYISPSASCAACGQAGVLLREVTRSFGRGPNLLVIEGIPMWSCPHCGESYFTAQTMHEIERIKALRKSVAIARPVPVAMFTGEGPYKALHRAPKTARR